MEKPNLIKDRNLGKKVAKGIIYAWASVITADGAYKEEEFNSLTVLAEKNEYVKEYFNKVTAKGTFKEAIEIVKNYSIDELFNRIEFVFREVDNNIKGHVFFTCLHLACVDHEIANREIMTLQKVYRALKIGIDQVFRISLLFFQNEFSRK